MKEFVKSILVSLLFIIPCYGADNLPYRVPVLVVRYYPVDGATIDIKKTGDWGRSLAETRTKVDSLTLELARFLGNASRYHAYRDNLASPSLAYEIVGNYEFLEPLPTVGGTQSGAPMTDYKAVVERVGGKEWVEEKGVKEIWLWGYHGGKVGLWESNMAGPFGDISNSDRDKDDLPVFTKTYTLYPPNAEKDYDWKNPRSVESDIEDWKPDGTGVRTPINCSRWNCSSLGWFMLWMESIPGAKNRLVFQGKSLTNWWMFVGDFDGAMRSHQKLTE